jgi:hypothetical protein
MRLSCAASIALVLSRSSFVVNANASSTKPPSMPSLQSPSKPSSERASMPSEQRISKHSLAVKESSWVPSEQPSSMPSCLMSPFEHTTTTTTATSIGETLSFPFTNLPLAATDVAISVSLRGDINGGDEWYYVEGEFSLVGYAASRYGNKYSQRSSSFVAEDFVISALRVNNVAGDGHFDLQLRPCRSQINREECSADAHQAHIKLSYIYCEPPPTITYVEDVKDYYQPGICEGDCDDDYDCHLGLVCLQRSSSNATLVVPGCKDTPESGTGYCAVPQDDQLVLMGDDDLLPAEFFPLGECQGDCDDDSDCQEGLKCFQRSGFTPVPGCSGDGSYSSDYCTVPRRTLPPQSANGIIRWGESHGEFF